MKLHKVIKKIFKYSVIVIILIIILQFGHCIFRIFHFKSSMKVGRDFMENLNDDELAYWAKDALKLYSIDSLRSERIGAIRIVRDEIDEKYRKCGIIRIDVNTNSVSYVWMGGVDHTSLHFEISSDSIESIIAVYNDYTRQKLYPVLEKVNFDYPNSKKRKLKGNKILTGELKIENNEKE